MCGIAGVVNFTGRPVERELLDRMGQKIRHRGPDDEGRFVDGAVGFAFERLAIIDLITGAQPMTAGPLTIVFNGEIYNYVELRETLQSRWCFRTTSDTEVILA